MALYNGGFPVTYPQMYQYTPVQAPAQASQATQAQGGLIWVQGEAGAKSYLVAPNNTVQLWDSESQTIYLKSADASGMPSMKVLDYTIRETPKNGATIPSVASADNIAIYATKDQIEALNDQIKALKKKVEKLSKEGEDDE